MGIYSNFLQQNDVDATLFAVYFRLKYWQSFSFVNGFPSSIKVWPFRRIKRPTRIKGSYFSVLFEASNCSSNLLSPFGIGKLHWNDEISYLQKNGR